MQEVKLHKAESPWKPTHKDTKETMEVKDEDETKTEELYKKARGILNKLTPQNFQTLVKQMSKLEITSEDHLQGVVNLVFEKAIAEPRFSVAYASMCRYLTQIKVPSTKKSGEFVNFRVILLTKCQKEFTKDKPAEDDIEALRLKLKDAEESKKAEIEAEIVVTKKNARRRSLGKIRFIGEIFKLKMLTEPIMHECVFKLLNSKDEESLECLCELLQTIGKELDSEKAKPRVDQYFQIMHKLVAEKKTSLRVKFILQDVIELRMSNWVPRRDKSNPKTIEQIHKEAQQEEQEKQLMVQSLNTQAKSGGGGGRGGRGGGDPRLGKDAGSMGATPDGWSTVAGPPSRKGERQTIDPARLRLSKNKWHMATSVSPPCDVCAGQSISKQAVEWCPECEEAYCSECIKHHGIAKATKHHQVIAVENYLKLPPFVLETKHHCKKHGSSFQNYCRSHETPCCKRCIDTDHKKCSDLPALDDVIQNAKSSVAFADIEERLHSLKKFFSEVITEKEENLNDLKVQREMIEKQIRKMRIEINQRLDILEKEILHELSNKENHHQRNIEKISKQMEVQSSRIESLLENMEPIKQYASNLQTFLSTKEIDRELYKTEREVEVLCEVGSLNRYVISVIMNDKLRNFIKDLKTFGEVSSSFEQTKIVHEKSKLKQAQIVAAPCTHVEDMNIDLW
ncbi:eukaryotic translation initiation factor 4 gamma 1-like [Mytilus edulis]|uniref:eukaryotic translation initiation factor 4 gamma 1-like n=1 Tax=Mytilus edulis TaxID=6550 RepID=UPI0039EEAF86